MYTQTGEGIQQLQKDLPVSGFTDPNPTKVAPLSGTQQSSLGLLNQNLNDARNTSLEESPIVKAGQRYFEKSIAPGIVNQSTLAGLGRSTALTNSLAAADAQTALPLLQGEQARRDQLINQGFQGGDIERGVEQAGYNSQAADALRRQGIAEQALFGPLGQLPSTFGQTVKNSSGGMFGTVICTELHRQGIMPDDVYEADSAFGASMPAHVMIGYQSWGKHVARAMQKSKTLTRLLTPLGMSTARAMQARIAGKKEPLLGRIVLKIGIPICSLIGRAYVRAITRRAELSFEG